MLYEVITIVINIDRCKGCEVCIDVCPVDTIAMKDEPEKGDKVILLGGDNYRIGMGGGAVRNNFV